jgi:hypothetical protein
LDVIALGERQMAIGNLLSLSPAGDMTTGSRRGHAFPSHDILAAIAQRSKTKQSAVLSNRLDAQRVIERAIEIDTEQPGSPLTEGQWDFGLDMLARADAPAKGTGLAARQERILVALSKALAEIAARDRATAA